jgi:hypothetical protein
MAHSHLSKQRLVEESREQSGPLYRGDAAGLPADHFRITIKNVPNPIYTALGKAYDWVSGLWHERHAVKLQGSLRELTLSTGDKVVFLKRFDRRVTNSQAIDWAFENGYRLAFPAEREAFSKANPDLQRNFWIVDLGSFALSGNRTYIHVLREDSHEWSLTDDTFFWGWPPETHFLFVRE